MRNFCILKVAFLRGRNTEKQGGHNYGKKSNWGIIGVGNMGTCHIETKRRERKARGGEGGALNRLSDVNWIVTD